MCHEFHHPHGLPPGARGGWLWAAKAAEDPGVMHWVQVPCFGCLPLGSGQLSAGLCSPGICLCFASQGKIPWREWKAQEVLYELTACCRLKRFVVTEETLLGR